ncbi:MAG TPA: uroporphyrinogen decarboxylase family protein [Dehalococcoidales bacterium]|nr:uroporphyrinogen decarboxylase family protein [Dehalococcoidales bacterium]
MAKIQPGYPENWATMTPLQKREWRQSKFVKGESIKFVNPEAQKAYKIRSQRIVDIYNLKEPDRVQVNLPIGDLPYNLYGINSHTAMYQVEKAVEACQQFNTKYSAELEYYAAPMTTPAKALEILDYKLYAWPGHGLSVNAPGYQFIEGEYMSADEYDDLIRDPSDFWLRTYLPRVFGILDSMRLISPLTDIIEIPTGQIGILGHPQIKATLRKLLEASDELERRAAITAPYMGQGPARGYPVTMGAFGIAPFDIIGDTMRGTTSIMKDMYRHPEKLLKAMDVIADIHIHNLLHSPNIHNMISIFFPLHKGADGWMSQKQFDKFYMPTLKKVMDALINEGLLCTLFAEGSYNTRLDSVNLFPKGSVTWLFDQTDMARAKQVLGKDCSIQGNVPSSLIVTGDPADVKAYCRKLIETCAPGGGYILAAGCTAENPKLDNLRAMLAAAKEYGVYKK